MYYVLYKHKHVRKCINDAYDISILLHVRSTDIKEYFHKEYGLGSFVVGPFTSSLAAHEYQYNPTLTISQAEASALSLQDSGLQDVLDIHIEVEEV